jgi:DNA-binding CsgD family transcriptional regulator
MNSDSRYQLPLTLLRSILGAPPTTDGPQTRDGLFHREWSCGCVARYRESVHQTATWRPCRLHHNGPKRVVATVPNGTTLTPDVLGRRLGPTFCIVDTSLKILCKSPGADVESLLEDAREHLVKAAQDGETVVIPAGNNALLRIVPLAGARSGTFAVVIERLRARGSLSEAAKHFSLTKRETEVLRLVVANRTNAEVAAELCIAESTVSDHMKSLYRKVGCNRRTELLTKLFLI